MPPENVADDHHWWVLKNRLFQFETFKQLPQSAPILLIMLIFANFSQSIFLASISLESLHQWLMIILNRSSWRVRFEDFECFSDPLEPYSGNSCCWLHCFQQTTLINVQIHSLLHSVFNELINSFRIQIEVLNGGESIELRASATVLVIGLPSNGLPSFDWPGSLQFLN